MIETCLLYANWSRVDELPLAESTAVRPHWRAACAFNSTLPVWLVVIPRRHVSVLDELNAEEVADLGLLLRSLTAALRAVVGCTKTYVILLASTTSASPTPSGAQAGTSIRWRGHSRPRSRIP